MEDTYGVDFEVPAFVTLVRTGSEAAFALAHTGYTIPCFGVDEIVPETLVLA